MSRKFKRPSGWYHKEDKPARKLWSRTNRHRTRALLRSQRYDDVTGPRRTSGWMTW